MHLRTGLGQTEDDSLFEPTSDILNGLQEANNGPQSSKQYSVENWQDLRSCELRQKEAPSSPPQK
jgi:hypothetical protein